MELLQDFHLIVAYKIVLSIEASFARFIRTKARANSDIVCPTNLRHDTFSVAALDKKIWSEFVVQYTYVPPVGRSLIYKPPTVYNTTMVTSGQFIWW